MYLLFKKEKGLVQKSLGPLLDYSLLLFKKMITKAKMQVIYLLGLQCEYMCQCEVSIISGLNFFYSEVTPCILKYPTAVAVLSGVNNHGFL